MTLPRQLASLLLIASIAACGSAAPMATSPTPAASASPIAGAPRPVVVTTDLGMDDLLALYVLLRDPGVDVRAIAVDGTGLVHCGPGLRTVRRILAVFNRQEIPFGCGRDTAGSDGVPFPDDWRASADDMYGVVLPAVVGTTFPPDATELLAGAFAAVASPLTVVALGPWTSLQDLYAADPSLVARTARIVAMAGAFDVPGNMGVAGVTPADGIEWNVGADPDAVAAVLALDVDVAFVPLDATDDVPVPPGILGTLEADHGAAGADIAYETYALSPSLSAPGNYWWDATTAVAVSRPELLAWDETSVTISSRGRLRRDPAGRPATVATSADTTATQEAILAGLRRGSPRAQPFVTTGTVRVTWDGTTCVMDPQVPTKAGMARVELVNTSSAPVGLLAAAVLPPHTWADAIGLITTADLADPSFAPPAWLVTIEGEGPYAEAGATAAALVRLPGPTAGFVCATGEWPKLSFADAGSIPLGD
jgi:inosine-uridine nucleoside N-ribohydrolase